MEHKSVISINYKFHKTLDHLLHSRCGVLNKDYRHLIVRITDSNHGSTGLIHDLNSDVH